MISPSTDIRLLKVPLTLDNKNQLTFNSKEEQYNYFNSLQCVQEDNCTYQRKDNIIRFPTNIDNIINYNYVIYQNENYNNKWFYAFITNMSYVNDNLTAISIATDVFQTWQFDIIYKESFVEREMCNVEEDTADNNLLVEGLETGEFKAQTTYEFNELEPVYVIAYIGNKIGDNSINQNGYKYNGIYSSITFLLTNILSTVLNVINFDGNGDKIFTVFTIPKIAVQDTFNDTNTFKVLENFTQNPIFKTLNSRPQNLDGYVPKNKKLLSYPYCYMGFNPPNGNTKIYRYEDFANGTPVFKIISEINPNPTVCFIPQNYMGISGDNVPESSSMNGYPQISYKNDYYNTWLAQNSEIINLNMQQEKHSYEVSQVMSGVNLTKNTINNALSLNIGGLLTDSINSGAEMANNDFNHEYYIKNQLAQVEKQKMLPDTANLSSSNATLIGYNLNDKSIFTSYTIKRQFAERIDKFFDMYRLFN